MKLLPLLYGLAMVVSSYSFVHKSAFPINTKQIFSCSARTKSMSSLKMIVFPDPLMIPRFQEALLLNGIQAAGLTAISQKFLTPAGLVHASLLGIGLLTFLGVKGWLVCVSYLLFGNIVTKIKMKEKERLGIAEKRGGARGPENVWGSAGVAMLCAIGTYIYPQYSSLLQTAYVASLATKLSDTCGSEIGKAYGKTTYLITTWSRVTPGTEGAVSVEGTLAGIVGSILLTGIAYLLSVINTPTEAAICIVSAFVGTTAESYIGASFQTDSIKWLTNELVNFINTAIGAATAISLILLLK